MHSHRSHILRSAPDAGRRLTVSAALAAVVGAPALCLGLRARAQPAGQPLHRTPAQTEGPFYPVELPRDADADLLRNGARSPYGLGDPAWVEGQVSDLAGRPLAGALVEIWQCDHAGRYHHPGDGNRASEDFQGFGRMRVGADGRYRFRTIRPVPYTGRTPHIHVKVKLGPRELLTTQLYVEGDPGNARDGIWRRLSSADRAAVTAPFDPGPDGLRARFPLVVEA